MLVSRAAPPNTELAVALRPAPSPSTSMYVPLSLGSPPSLQPAPRSSGSTGRPKGGHACRREAEADRAHLAEGLDGFDPALVGLSCALRHGVTADRTDSLGLVCDVSRWAPHVANALFTEFGFWWK